jgi:hypothetical protein
MHVCHKHTCFPQILSESVVRDWIYMQRLIENGSKSQCNMEDVFWAAAEMVALQPEIVSQADRSLLWALSLASNIQGFLQSISHNNLSTKQRKVVCLFCLPGSHLLNCSIPCHAVDIFGKLSMGRAGAHWHGLVVFRPLTVQELLIIEKNCQRKSTIFFLSKKAIGVSS